MLAAVVSIVALTAVPALATGGGVSPTSTLAASSEDTTVQVDAAAYYAQQYGVSLATAEQRLQIQDDSQRVLEQVVKTLGNQWAGSWYDPNDQGRFKVGVATTQSSPSGSVIDQARSILATTGVDGYTDFVSEPSSWSQLVTAQQSIDSQFTAAESAGTVRTAIDPTNNSVVIDTAQSISTADMSQVETTNTAGVRITIKKVHVASLQTRSQACVSSNPGNEYSTPILSCDPPLRGGQAIHGGLVKLCTAGYIVDSNDNGLPYLLTAGHCIDGAGGVGIVWSGRQTGDWHSIGAAHSENWPAFSSGVDAGLINIDDDLSTGWNTYGSPSYTWVGPSWEGITTQNSFYPINGTAHSSLNMTVCTTSAPQLPQTGHHTDCGSVLGLGETIGVLGYPNETKVAETNMCYTPGSSGGPVYKNNIGYGINSAANPDNGCDSFYASLPDALTNLKVHLQ